MPDQDTPRASERAGRSLFRRRREATTLAAAAKPEPRQSSMPAVRTFLDMAAPPAVATVGPAGPGAGGVIREWELGDYGVLMTDGGVLYSLDPVAYRVWRLHRGGQPLTELASAVAADCDLEQERALAVTATLLDRLRGTFCAEGR
jgi:Coenzyme PQQ synthesis protein D (PqqD)